MWILGIAGSHNAGVALIRDGTVVVAIQAERLTRSKRQSIMLDQMGGHAGAAIQYCLRYAGIDLPDLDAIATSTPWAAVTPRFALADGFGTLTRHLPRYVTVPHHLAHAEYALHYSPMRPCLVLVCDGSGTFEDHRALLDIQENEDRPVRFVRDGGKESISAYRFDGRDLKLIYRIAYGEERDLAGDASSADRIRQWQASLGHLWEWSALYCHGSSFEAGKVMGLAPFGDPDVHGDLQTIALGPQGDVRLDLQSLWHRFRTPNTEARDVTGDHHYEDLAAHIQKLTNVFLLDLVRFLLDRSPASDLCYSGGVALNSIANEYIRSHAGVNLHMNGSCEDNGTAIGAALAAYHALTGRREPEPITDYLGREYGAQDIDASLRGHNGPVTPLSRSELVSDAASAIAGGDIIGWFQGRSEFGPRALGNRSILADPRNPEIQNKLNRDIKFREAFRPYAPAVIEARAAEFFEMAVPSPVMLRVVKVRSPHLPGITHVDGTARVQTVGRDQNPLFYDLLKAYEARTGVPVLLNTSFNIAGEPIVETPAEALRTFSNAGMDRLYMGDFKIGRAS